ncbi:MAG TPA: hypothetical protein VHT49_11910, partial [Acidimicrobiales bacterium]|nr:hypothetical protein [Acidimicrobiales bacterium]
MSVRMSDPVRPLTGNDRYGRRPPVKRRGAVRRMVVAIIAVLAVAVGITALSIDGSRATGQRAATGSSPQALARTDSSAFLHRYLGADGRVVRTDQGGDT